MGLDALPAGFWTLAISVFGALATGVGWLVKTARSEANDLNARVVARSEEAAECKVRIIYLEAANSELKEEKKDLEERCERLEWELRHRPPS